MLFYLMATCWRQIGGYHCIGWSHWLFLQDLHSWWIPTFQKNVLLLSLWHQHWRWRWWHCVLPQCWYPPTTTQLNAITLPTAIRVFTTVKTINFHTLILSVTNIHKSFLRNTVLHIIQNTARAYYNLLILASTNVSSSCTKST